MDEDILEAVRQMIAEMKDIDPSEVDEDSDVYYDLNMNELDLQSLQFKIEEKYGIEIPDKYNFKMVSDIVDIIEKQAGK